MMKSSTLLNVNTKCRNPYALVQPELQLSLVNVDYPIMLMWKSVARDARSVGACLTNEAVTEIVLSTRDVYHSSCLVKNYFQSCCYVLYNLCNEDNNTGGHNSTTSPRCIYSLLLGNWPLGSREIFECQLVRLNVIEVINSTHYYKWN